MVIIYTASVYVQKFVLVVEYICGFYFVLQKTIYFRSTVISIILSIFGVFSWK